MRSFYLEKKGVVVGIGPNSLGWQFHWGTWFKNSKFEFVWSAYGRNCEGPGPYIQHRLCIIRFWRFQLWMDLGRI